jgi:aryl sulfotransferase
MREAMMPALLKAPTRTLRSRLFDSQRWDGYRPRSTDIIIGTYSKCGATWMQRIVGMLIFGSAEPKVIRDISIWPDMRLRGPVAPLLEAAEAQTHRRFFKTYMPLDALPIYEGVKFIHVARDGRDAAMSQQRECSIWRSPSREG